MTRLFTWNKVQKAAFLVVIAGQNLAFAATDFQYFGGDIDYWHEKASKPPPAKEKQTAPTESNKVEVTQGDKAFPWDKYLDPKNKEFFKEGDYVPPEPFMEIVRNPTDSNLKMWFSYIDKKNELTRRLQERMQDYLTRNGTKIEPTEAEAMKSKLASLPISDPDAKRYRFRMYFDSHCPHCKKMFGTLMDLQARGFYVEAKQVDSDPRGLEGLGIPSSRATPSEIQEKDIQSVPVLLIGDLQKKTVYRLSGYQTTANVFAAINQAQ